MRPEKLADIDGKAVLVRDIDLSNLGSEVADDELAVLSHATYAISLNLSGTEVTDGSIEHLITLKDLRNLAITGTRITAEGVAELREALPDCNIVSDFDEQ